MNKFTWYTFEDDNHSYGYSLFYPFQIANNKAYGFYISCNDSGPNFGANPSAWIRLSIGMLWLDSELEDAASEYYDAKGRQPPTHKQMLERLFLESDFFLSLYDNEIMYLN